MVRLVVALAMLWSLAIVVALAVWSAGAQPQWLGAVGWPLAAATLATFAANHLLRFLRWHLMLRAEGHRVAWRRSLSIFLAGLALLPTPAKAGVAARSLLLLSEGVPVHVSIAAYFAERLLDLLGLAILASVLVEGLAPGAGWMLPFAIGVVGMVVIVLAPAALRAAAPRTQPHPRLAHALSWARQCFADAGDMLSGWRLLAFLGLGALANALTGLLLWDALHGAIGAAHAVGVVAVSHLSGSISLMPGGIGGFELAMLAQLSTAGVAAVEALTALWLVRIVTLWGSVAVGLPLLALGLRRVGTI
jgi:uncharacterized membrane protein YbhN (UPF0104 family)